MNKENGFEINIGKMEMDWLWKLMGIGIIFIGLIWGISSIFGNVEINIGQTLIQGITTAVALGVGNHFIVEKYIKKDDNMEKRIKTLEEKVNRK